MSTCSILARPAGSVVRVLQASSLPAKHQKPLVRSFFSTWRSACLPRGGPTAPARPSARRACSQTTHHQPLILQRRTYSSELKPRRDRDSRQRVHDQPREEAQPTPPDFQPPPRRQGQFLVQWGFTGVCVYIWYQWQSAKSAHAKNYRDRGIVHLNNDFVLSERNIEAGRWYTILSSAVSHENLLHLATNMISFHAFVGAAWQLGLSPASVVVVGAASAASCGLAQLANDRRAGVQGNALGASGLVSGLGGYVTVLAPRLRFMVLLIPVSIPLWVLTPALLSWDLYNTGAVNSGIGHAGHVGGGLCGLVLGFARRLWFRF